MGIVYSQALESAGKGVRFTLNGSLAVNSLSSRFGLAEALVARMARLNLLYDRDAAGEYFQFYSRAIAKRMFFEVVERRGYDGYGAANASIRLSAQAQHRDPPGV